MNSKRTYLSGRQANMQFFLFSCTHSGETFFEVNRIAKGEIINKKLNKEISGQLIMIAEQTLKDTLAMLLAMLSPTLLICRWFVIVNCWFGFHPYSRYFRFKDMGFSLFQFPKPIKSAKWNSKCPERIKEAHVTKTNSQ